MATSDALTTEQADNRILAPGVTRHFSYDGDTGYATFFLGDFEVMAQLPFVSAQAIADHFLRSYQEGVRDGLTMARREIQALERANG